MAMRRKKGAGKKLAPLDFENNPKEEGEKPKITQKRDLLEVCRHLKASQSAPAMRQDKNPLMNMLEQDTGGDSSSKEVEHMEGSVHTISRRYNDIRIQADRKEAALDRMKDELTDLNLEFEMVEANLQKRTPEARRIESLGKEIQKVGKDMEDKLFYQNQLSHMSKRLSSNQMSFDAHLHGMEEALNLCEKEYVEVKLLLRQLEAGKSQANINYVATQKQLDLEAATRRSTLASRRTDAENCRRIEQWRQNRDLQRQEYNSDKRGDMANDGERILALQLAESEKTQSQMVAVRKQQTETINGLEEAFQRIRQATGVRSLDEMVEKFMGQDSNTEALEVEKREAEARLVRAKGKREDMNQAFVEMKSSGIGGSELNREVYDKLAEDILGSKAALKVNKASSDRLEAVLVAIRQGAMGLAQRLAPFKGMIEHHEELNIPHSGIDSLDSLHISELKLSKMVEATAQPAGGGSSFNADGEDGGDDASREDDRNRPWTPYGNDDPPLNVNNLRVRSMQLLAQMEEATGGAAKQAVDAYSEEDEDDEEDDDEGDTEVPSRTYMKKSSERTYNDTVKRTEQAEKRAIMLERIKGEDGDIDPALASMKMRKKQQAKANKRLAQGKDHKHGVNPRDDAMSRSETFLKNTPSLQ